MPTTQNTPPTGTLATANLADIWLPAYHDVVRDADILRTLYERTKQQAAADAIWHGYCALLERARQDLQAIRECGGLLFAWSGSAAVQGGAA